MALTILLLIVGSAPLAEGYLPQCCTGGCPCASHPASPLTIDTCCRFGNPDLSQPIGITAKTQTNAATDTAEGLTPAVSDLFLTLDRQPISLQRQWHDKLSHRGDMVTLLCRLLI
jgi:hypothetical protein